MIAVVESVENLSLDGVEIIELALVEGFVVFIPQGRKGQGL